jgi:hypothetical protein
MTDTTPDADLIEHAAGAIFHAVEGNVRDRSLTEHELAEAVLAAVSGEIERRAKREVLESMLSESAGVANDLKVSADKEVVARSVCWGRTADYLRGKLAALDEEGGRDDQ